MEGGGFASLFLFWRKKGVLTMFAHDYVIINAL